MGEFLGPGGSVIVWSGWCGVRGFSDRERGTIREPPNPAREPWTRERQSHHRGQSADAGAGAWAGPYAGGVATESAPRPRTRASTVAVAVVVAQGLTLIVFGAWLMLVRSGDTPSNESVYQGSTAYMFVTGALVLLVAVAAWRGVGWAMSAAVLVELLALAVTYEMAKEGFWVGAVPLGLASLGALLALLSPSGRAAFGRS